jgi:hypothetical protein
MLHTLPFILHARAALITRCEDRLRRQQAATLIARRGDRLRRQQAATLIARRGDR